MGKWVVAEYMASSGRRIKLWTFPSFQEAELFRLNRAELYRSVGLDKKRRLTAALPKICKMEMDLFEEIIQNPEMMVRIKRRFLC